MKIKIITLAYILLFGSFCFADNSFFSGGFSLSAANHLTGFYSRTVKSQPAMEVGAFLHGSFTPFFSAGLSADFFHASGSSLDEGWSYPGFSGLELGADMLGKIPGVDFFSMGTGAGVGWYHYNLTENYFFLPFTGIYPAFLIMDNYFVSLSAELPFKYYFHRQADVFLSVGIRLRVTLK